MPEPLAQPRMRTCLPPMLHFAAAHFGRVSVVMMARANCVKVTEPDERAFTSAGIAARILSTRNSPPMTPVEQTTVSAGFMPEICFARAEAVAREAGRPSFSVQQLALAELTMAARMRPLDLRRCSLEISTGAATT